MWRKTTSLDFTKNDEGCRGSNSGLSVDVEEMVSAGRWVKLVIQWSDQAAISLSFQNMRGLRITSHGVPRMMLFLGELVDKNEFLCTESSQVKFSGLVHQEMNPSLMGLDSMVWICTGCGVGTGEFLVGLQWHEPWCSLMNWNQSGLWAEIVLSGTPELVTLRACHRGLDRWSFPCVVLLVATIKAQMFFMTAILLCYTQMDMAISYCLGCSPGRGLCCWVMEQVSILEKVVEFNGEIDDWIQSSTVTSAHEFDNNVRVKALSIYCLQSCVISSTVSSQHPEVQSITCCLPCLGDSKREDLPFFWSMIKHTPKMG